MRDKIDQAAALAWKYEVCAGYDRAGTHAHHIVPQQTLRRRARDLGLDANVLLWDPRNGMPLSERRHARHHSGHEPLTALELPVSVFEFAAEYGLSWWLEKHVAQVAA